MSQACVCGMASAGTKQSEFFSGLAIQKRNWIYCFQPTAGLPGIARSNLQHLNKERRLDSAEFGLTRTRQRASAHR
ncbi:hypothetical protein RLEG12_07910 (plasmid) [Rhizobium leguminosarum bv. trifolii CB782]|nr:hypothetical protein RLEG12_07910 [Rhizobium leguminosarum bv. trifolii CB782]